jgi:hypothetical protein
VGYYGASVEFSVSWLAIGRWISAIPSQSKLNQNW